jgi:hypothetical protein
VEKNIIQQKQRGYNPIFEVWLWYQLILMRSNSKTPIYLVIW